MGVGSPGSGQAPILWAGRLVAFLIVAGAAVLLALLVLRLLRPSTMRKVLTGDLPPLKSVRGTIEVLGQKFEANAEMDWQRDEQLLALEDRVLQLEDLTNLHGTLMEDLLERGREEHT